MLEEEENMPCRKNTCCLCFSVQLYHTALGNSMSLHCPEEGNGDPWLELQTLAPSQYHKQTEWWTDISLASSGNGEIPCSSVDNGMQSLRSGDILIDQSVFQISISIFSPCICMYVWVLTKLHDLPSCEQHWWASVFGGQVTMETGMAIDMVNLSGGLVLLGSPDVIQDEQ